MAQFFTDFADTPALTEEWHTTDGSYTIETTGLPTGNTGTAALKIVMTSNSRYAISWDDVGTPTGDVELLMRWQVDVDAATSTGNSARAVICGGGGTTDEDGYFASHEIDGVTTVYSPGLAEYDASAPTILGTSTTVVMDDDVWYWTRIEKTGTTIRCKTWSGTIGSEPGSWDVSVTDSTLTGGWVGPGQFESSQVLWIDVMGAGTGGDAAPDDDPVIDETAGSDTILADDSGTDTVIWMETGSSDSLDAVITATEILAWSELTGSDTLLAIDSATEILAWLEIAGSDPVLIIDSGTDHLTHYELTGTDTILISESGFDAIGFLEITGSDTILVVDSAPTDILAWSEVSGTDTVLIVDSGTESFIIIPGNIPVEMRFLRSISTARVMILSGDSPPVSVTRLAPYVPVKIMRFR